MEINMKNSVAFVGVGAMGSGMVASLLRKGFAVTFLARDTTRGRVARDRLARAGAKPVSTLASLATAGEVVVLCLPDSPTVEAVLGDSAGLVANLPSGCIVIDCSTSHPDSTRRLSARLAPRGITLLDGPLTGSRVQAEAGALNVLGAGPAEAFDRARPVLEGFAARIFHLGESGAGHAAKLINNFLGQLALAGLCEAWTLLDRYKIDLRSFHDAISVSGGNSATFQGSFPRLRDRDFSLNFAQHLAGKDVGYLARLVHDAGGPAPLADCLAGLYQRSIAGGFGGQDVTGLLQFYESAAAKSGDDSRANGERRGPDGPGGA